MRRIEVWSLPDDPDGFRHLLTPEVVSFSSNDRFDAVGNGTLAVPRSYAHIDQIVDADPADVPGNRSSLISVFDDDYSEFDPCVEFFAEESVEVLHDNQPIVQIKGAAVKAAADDAIVAPNPQGGGPWVWGDISGNRLVNPGFETYPFPNGGFEDGNNNYWQLTTDDGFLTAANSLIAVNNPSEAQAGNWYGFVDPGNPAKSGAARTFSGLEPGAVYTITGWMLDPTASGDRWRAGVTAVTSGQHTNAYEEDGYWWAEVDNAPQGTGSSDGTWQQFTLEFTATSDTLKLVIIYDDTGPGPSFRIDSWTITGNGIGLYPWEPLWPPLTTVFEYQTSIVDSGEGALAWRATDTLQTNPFGVTSWGHTSGIRQAVALNVGQPYLLRFRVRQDSGSPRNYIIGAGRQSPVGTPFSPSSYFMNSAVVSVPSGVWTTLEITFVADVSEGWAQLQYLGQAGQALSPVTYTDTTLLFEGLPATSAGDIASTLLDEAHSRGTLLWLKAGFDADDDANGDAWDTSELSFRADIGELLGTHVLDGLRQFGYQWKIQRLETADGAFTHELILTNPGGLEGTAANGIVAGALTGGSFTKRRVAQTHLLVESAGGENSWVTDARYSGLTRREGFLRGEQAADIISAERLGTETLDFDVGNLTAVQARVMGGMAYRDFNLGWTVPFTLAARADQHPRKIASITLSFDGVGWTDEVTGSRFFPSDSADGGALMWESLRRLLTEFKRKQRFTPSPPSRPVPSGGAPTIVIAAQNSTGFSQARADYIWLESMDQDALNALMATFTNGARILWCEGRFDFVGTGGGGGPLVVTARIQFEGMGSGTTIHRWLPNPDLVCLGNNGFRDMTFTSFSN